MKGLIVSSGAIKDYELLKKIVAKNDYIVCADGGVNHLLKIGKMPDIVLGDLDSIGKEELNLIKKENIKIEKFPTMKDETDTELCIDYILKKGFNDITLMGVTGTRLDHTLANVYLLKKIDSLKAKASIVDEHNIIHYVKDSIFLNKREDFFISIIPIDSDGVVVSLDGFLYPLENEYLDLASTRGISNKIIEEVGYIKICQGSAIVIESKD